MDDRGSVRSVSATLLVFTTLLILSATAPHIANIPKHGPPPVAEISVKSGNGSVIVDHLGGDPVPLRSLSIVIANATDPRSVRVISSSEGQVVGDSDDMLECGERIIVPIQESGLYDVKVLIRNANLAGEKVYVESAGAKKRRSAPVWVAEVVAQYSGNPPVSAGSILRTYPRAAAPADCDLYIGQEIRELKLRVYSNGTVVSDPPQIGRVFYASKEECRAILASYEPMNETRWFENETHVGWIVNLSDRVVYRNSSSSPVFNITTRSSVSAAILVRKDAREIVVTADQYVYIFKDAYMPGTGWHERWEHGKSRRVMLVINETGWCSYVDGSLIKCDAGMPDQRDYDAYYYYYAYDHFGALIRSYTESALRAKPTNFFYRIEEIT